MGVGACRARPVTDSPAEASGPSFVNQWGEEGLSWALPVGAGRAELGRAGASLSLPGPAHGPRARKEGSLYASGVLCRDSLAERDKVQCPSTSPGSL